MRPRTGGFSIVEMLVALTISATLLAATFGALDASFKSYKRTTESASTHVVTRIVMHRVMTMIRTGTDFGPFPNNPIEMPEIESDWIEFVARVDDDTGESQVARIERRDSEEDGLSELWMILTTVQSGVVTDIQERPLLVGVLGVRFLLEYDVGPTLRRATVDLTVLPNDLQDVAIAADLQTPSIRMVASASPRNF